MTSSLGPLQAARREVPLELSIYRKREVADGVIALTLRREDGAELPRWLPGAHVDLELPNGLIRQYSLCGDPAWTTSWQVAVLREDEGRGGSLYVADSLAEGDVIPARGPRNNFELHAAPSYVFIAGGIGITPILPMIAHAARAGLPFALHYGGRSRRSMAFLDELVERYGDRLRVYPQDEVGLIDLDAALRARTPGGLVYCCGPEPLLKVVEQRVAHLSDDILRVERFAPRELGASASQTPFHVRCARSGVEFDVTPHESILDAAEAAGLAIPFACREGTCGTCETAVLSGEVEHRDSILTASERAAGETMFVCVSRALGDRLELDL